jgi:hypothetical protein
MLRWHHGSSPNQHSSSCSRLRHSTGTCSSCENACSLVVEFRPWHTSLGILAQDWAALALVFVAMLAIQCVILIPLHSISINPFLLRLAGRRELYRLRAPVFYAQTQSYRTSAHTVPALSRSMFGHRVRRFLRSESCVYSPKNEPDVEYR